MVASGLGDIGDVKVDGTGTAYTTDYGGARLLAVDLSSGSSRMVAAVSGAYGVALDGTGKAYVVSFNTDGGNLYEVNLADGTNRLVTTLPGASTIRVALDGAGKAYTIDNLGGRLYEITLADGAQRVVAFGLGTCGGLALDTVHGYIYVSNFEGQLWQISQSAAQALGGVGKVVA